MRRILRLLARLLDSQQWHDIATAPMDCPIELAIITDGVGALASPVLRREDGWFDASTMQPADVHATHWRYWQPTILPLCC